MTREQLIEAMARAMCADPDECVHGSGWATQGGGGFECYIKAWEQKKPIAEKQMRAIEAADLCIVPREVDTLNASYAFVESLIPRADQYAGDAPLWHGWALREAFIAGATMVKALKL